MTFTVDVKNPGFTKYNKLIAFTDDPMINAKLVNETAANLGYYNNGSYNLTPFDLRWVTPGQYDDIKSQNKTYYQNFDDIREAQEDLMWSIRDYADARELCVGAGTTCAGSPDSFRPVSKPHESQG